MWERACDARTEAVRLDDGRELTADLFVFALGAWLGAPRARRGGGPRAAVLRHGG